MGKWLFKASYILIILDSLQALPDDQAVSGCQTLSSELLQSLNFVVN